MGRPELAISYLDKSLSRGFTDFSCSDYFVTEANRFDVAQTAYFGNRVKLQQWASTAVSISISRSVKQLERMWDFSSGSLFHACFIQSASGLPTSW
jgi:hypothetical protein